MRTMVSKAESEVLIEYEAKVLSRVSDVKWGVVDFGKFFTETSEQKFSLRGVKCKICSHPGRKSIQSILKVIYAGVKVSRKEGKEE